MMITKCRRFSEIIKVRCCTQHLELSKNSKSWKLFPRWQKEPPELRLGVKLCMSFASQDIVFLSQRMCIDAVWEYDKGGIRQRRGKRKEKKWWRKREKDEKEGGGRIQSLVASTLYHFLVFFFFFWLCCVACRVLVSNQGLNLCHLHWELGVLATGPPGTSPLFYFKHIMSAELGQIPECHDTSGLQLVRLYLLLK